MNKTATISTNQADYLPTITTDTDATKFSIIISLSILTNKQTN